jgi:hypothetical protein
MFTSRDEQTAVSPSSENHCCFVPSGTFSLDDLGVLVPSLRLEWLSGVSSLRSLRCCAARLVDADLSELVSHAKNVVLLFFFSSGSGWVERVKG